MITLIDDENEINIDKLIQLLTIFFVKYLHFHFYLFNLVNSNRTS